MDPVQPSALEKIMAVVKPIAIVLVALAGGILAVAANGTVLPAWLTAICTSILGIGAALGIGSSGLNKPPDAPLK